MAQGKFRATLALWAILYAGSFAVFWLVEPTGDSFTRGLNRIGWFLLLQLVAAGVAIALWLLSRNFPPGTAMRWAARAPAVLALLLVGAIASLYIYGNLARTDPDSPPPPKPPTTIPVAPGN